MHPDTSSGGWSTDDGSAASNAVRELAQTMRMASWEIALRCVATAADQGVLPSLSSLTTVHQLANLPALIGGLATALIRPRPRGHLGANPVLTRLARDHAAEREAVGFSAKEIVQEFLLVRRVVWRFVQERATSLDAKTILLIEDRLNSILDEVIAECTVEYFDRATHELNERAQRDALTGLLNHQALVSRLSAELDRSRRYGHPLQVIYFDLDEFKQVNDTYGHGVGDVVLQTVSGIISDSIRESDIAGRMGGDEFVISIVESNGLAAHLLIDRLRARLDRRIAERTIPSGIGISAGCASFPEDGDSVEDLLGIADQRQYADKRARKTPFSES